MKRLFEINEITNFDELCKLYVEMLNERNKIFNYQSDPFTKPSKNKYKRIVHINDLLYFIKIKMKQIMTMNFDTLPF